MSVLHKLCCFLMLFQAAVGSQNVTVTTLKGVVEGVRVDPNPNTAASYDAFLGIPYGKVPARFQPSVPRDSWTSPLVAQTDGPMCPQLNQPYSEDCLYLNVYTPVSASQHPGKYPVMVYIHGGGFTFGSSSSLQYGPDFLVPEGVILVTMNYRLGAAGFLTLGTPEAPGNLGLYDTALGLQWVQQEIQVFGGDPGHVTMFGHSAGSVLVLLHYMSPVSSGLFHLAIAQSGPPLLDGGIMSAKEAVRRAKVLSDAVGCDSSSLSDAMLLSCLQNVDISTLVAKQNISLPFETLARGETLRFLPVLDTTFAKSPFFPGTSKELTSAALARSKPLMTGFASGDGIVKFQDTDQVWKLAEANLASFVPSRFQESVSDSGKFAMATKIKQRYFSESVDQNKILNLVELYTDQTFAYPIIKMARALANLTYGYIYDYQGVWNPIPPYFSQFQMTGAFHGADLSYLFYSVDSSQDLERCSVNRPSLRMRDTMVRLWTTFAKTGSPDSTGSWETVSTGHYLVLGEDSTLVNSSEVERQHYRFWADLAPDDSTTATVAGNLALIASALWALACISL